MARSDSKLRHILWVALAVAAAALLLGCNTYNQIQETPEEVWVSVWLLLEAFTQDIIDAVVFVTDLIL